MSDAICIREPKAKGPSSGPFAALWLMLKALLASWGKPGATGFDAAFEHLEEQVRRTLLAQAIAAHNADYPDGRLSADDFELRTVMRGRRADYEIVSKQDGSVIGCARETGAGWYDAEAARAWFDARRRLGRYMRWTWVRRLKRGKVCVAIASRGRAGRRRLASMLRASSRRGARALSRATASRAPP